jgi:hypothetical protein
MHTNLTTAIVSASGSVLAAIVAILSNNRRFDDVNRRIDRVETRLDMIEQRFLAWLEHIDYMLASYRFDVARIEERLDIK